MKLGFLKAVWIPVLLFWAITAPISAQDEAPVITSAPAASANLGQPFSYTITTTGTAPFSFSATGVPLGLSLIGNTLAGIPQQFGTFAITLNAFNAFGTDTQVLTLTVAADTLGQPPIITSNSFVNATQFAPFNFSVTAVGAPPINITINGLPAGLSFDGQTISGIPTVSGTFTPVVTATSASGTAFQTLTIDVFPGFPTAGVPPVITSPFTATGITGQPFSFVINTQGTIPITLSALGLPSGLALVGNTISGIPTTAGNFTVQLSATNVAGSEVRLMTISILELTIPTAQPVITNPLTANTTVGATFSFNLSATGQAPISFTATALPPGLTLAGSTISGTPLQAGSFPVTLTATNSAGSDIETLVITVESADPFPPSGTAPVITSPGSATGLLNQPFVFNATATGSGTISFTATGLPQGLTIALNGQISGTPIQSGTFPVLLTATSIFGTQQQTLVLQILPSQTGVPVFAIPFTIDATVGNPFSFELFAVGTQPIVFSATNLPPGISLVGNTLTGSPILAGNFVATVSAVNSFGSTTQNLFINVSAGTPSDSGPPVITSPIFGTGTVGSLFSFPLTASGAGPISFSTSLLPPGLSLLGTTITGVPQFSGNSQITVTATNAIGSASQDILLTFNTPGRLLPAGITPVFTLTGTTSGVVGQSFVLPLSTIGAAPVFFSTTGLPAGLTLSGDTISGSPLVAGTFSVTVTAQNTFGTSTQSMLFSITEPGVSTFDVQRMQVLLNRSSSGRDSIKLEGSVELPANTAGGQTVSIDIGGVVRSYTLNANGVARSGRDLLRLKNRRSETQHRLSVTLRGDFAANLQQYMNAASAPLPVTLTVGGNKVQTELVLTQSSQGNVTRAKFARRN